MTTAAPEMTDFERDTLSNLARVYGIAAILEAATPTPTADDFARAVNRWVGASGRSSIDAAREALDAITPAGLHLRPSASGHAVNVHLAGESESVALFYLNEHRSRVRSPRLVKLAWAAILAMGEAK
jgi:hypothetical protein